jgi:hypothetical protein
MENQTISSIFLGQVRRKTYDTNYVGKVYETSELVEYRKIFECVLNKPPLEVKDKIYIPEMDVTLQVVEIIKTVDGSITYRTNYTIKTIEDEKTEKSFKEANEESVKLIESLKVQKAEEFARKENAQFNETHAIARCLKSDDDNIIVVYYNPLHKDMKLIDVNSKSVISMDVFAQKKLTEFTKFIATKY